MLVLTRRIGEEIVIDGNIRVTVTSVKGDKVRIGVSAPPNIRVDRAEVHRRLQEFAADPEPIVACNARGRQIEAESPIPFFG
jgi:carbon storage regulator